MRFRAFAIVCGFLALSLLLFGAGSLAQESQSPSLVYDEARTVYLGNLERRANGVPPLRWNRQLTEAARWFSWDSVENRPSGYCGHQDTQGHWPGWRASAFGYLGFAGAENCFCGYVTPEYAIQGWMDSPGHRANLLDPNSREIGLGYYRRESDGRGYVTQDFGSDSVYPPVIIENEALSTSSSLVDLYIHSQESSGGFAGMGAATHMMVANDVCFTDAAWEAYSAEKTWTLEPGDGWRNVYVKTRDALSRTVMVSDTIYLGSVPLAELGLEQASSTADEVTLYGLDGGGLPYVQFSLGWLADDTFDTFGHLWGNGARVSDPSAWGGSAFRLSPGAGESFAWVWTTGFVTDVPLEAYFRLKVNDNTSAGEVARVSVQGGATEYGPLSLAGTDFAAANAYQEFALPFTFQPTDDDPFLILKFWRSGSADVYVDMVSIFTAPQPVTDPLTWAVPGGNYRGQGVWVRFTDGGDSFSPIAEADLYPTGLAVTPSALTFLAARDGVPPSPQVLLVHQLGCHLFDWQVAADAPWLHLQRVGDTVELEVDRTGLDVGTYYATVTLEAVGDSAVGPTTVPVTLVVAETLYYHYLPLVLGEAWGFP
jgi:uncharacterized protein YkwD